MRKWALPEAIDDVLPSEAARVEVLRRTMLDCFREHGYRLVQPPLVEYLDSLLTGSGRDLDLQTFKTVDPMSGRLLGLRADTTPQVARIDAHLLNESGVSRLCYAGSVLRTLPAGPGATREVLQIGAELYGHAGIAADREVLRLLLEALASAQLTGLHVDLGHVGIYRALARSAGLQGDGEGEDSELFTALRDKDEPSVQELTAAYPEPSRTALRQLPELYGPAASTLSSAQALLPALPGIDEALQSIASLAEAAADRAVLHVDLADLRGYHYYTGATFDVFAADARGTAVECGRGGRYDGVGRAFGRARPATGFTLDLRRVTSLGSDVGARDPIVAPDDDDPALVAKIRELRTAGEAVVVLLPGETVGPRTGRRLAQDGAVWRICASESPRAGIGQDHGP